MGSLKCTNSTTDCLNTQHEIDGKFECIHNTTEVFEYSAEINKFECIHNTTEVFEYSAEINEKFECTHNTTEVFEYSAEINEKFECIPYTTEAGADKSIARTPGTSSKSGLASTISSSTPGRTSKRKFQTIKIRRDSQ